MKLLRLRLALALDQRHPQPPATDHPHVARDAPAGPLEDLLPEADSGLFTSFVPPFGELSSCHDAAFAGRVGDAAGGARSRGQGYLQCWEEGIVSFAAVRANDSEDAAQGAALEELEAFRRDALAGLASWRREFLDVLAPLSARLAERERAAGSDAWAERSAESARGDGVGPSKVEAGAATRGLAAQVVGSGETEVEPFDVDAQPTPRPGWA
mmetsp:Transcript_2444/g.6665  ORF Transcript_2444/g.6665 Transcript_2444/m.6665 type:complete len:212 (-) Transcript_2444:97-732(-)